MQTVLGIDIGGSGIKGAPVDVETGALAGERFRIPTPEGGQPEPMAQVVKALVEHFDWHGPVGVGFPAVIRHGTVFTAANLDPSWIGTPIEQMLSGATGCPVRAVNDADAAGLAEMRFGAGAGKMGVVILLTLGTGIGSAIFTDGKLVPNTEFGHLVIRGKDAERRASDAARERKNMTWERYASRLSEYLNEMEKLFWPDLFIIGGGISKQHAEFLPLLQTNTPVIPAQLLNLAGIVGAALAVGE